MIEVGVEEESVDRSRLGELYVRYAPEGIKLAYLLTGDRMLAEDLVQEAFARFVGRLGHLRHPDAFGSYLRSTIVNLSRSHFRRRKVERAYVQSVMRAPTLPPPVDTGFDHEVHEALLRLPERQRAALVLRFYEDLSDTQTAEVMRCRPGTVRSLVSRAMQTIRAEVGVTVR